MIKVGINGYGTIGRRIAHAINLQQDMTVVGIVKTRPDYVSKIASKTYNLFTSDKGKEKDFLDAGIRVRGTLDDLISSSDVIIDSTPEGIGEKNKRLYSESGVGAIFQGGEKSSIADASFNAYASYERAMGKKYVRVVSCNTTGLARTLYPLKNRFGLKHVDATLIRRATDPNDSKKGPINAIEPSLKIPSHHAPDLRTVMEDVNIDTVALKVPTTLMHVHVIKAELEKGASRDEIIDEWMKYRRIIGVHGKDGLTSTAQVMDAAREAMGNRSDLYEIAIWGESIVVNDGRLSYIQAVHQESDVIPENVDAVRSMFEMQDREGSIDITDKSLGIGRRNL